jgi:hypothetical protein
MKINDFEKSISLRLLEIEEDVINDILSNCSNSIKVFKEYNELLFSGMVNRGTYFTFIDHSPIHRRPRGMSIDEQEYIDECLTLAGFSALRSNSIFCISDYSQAKNFGDAFIIIPINGFSFTGINSRRYLNYVSLPDISGDDGVTIDMADFIVRNYGFFHDDFAHAVFSENEVMINGSYRALRLKSPGTKRILKKLGLDIKQR